MPSTPSTTSAEPASGATEQSVCGLLFVRLAHVSRARLSDALSGMGLRPADFAVLHNLAETEGATQLQLARVLRIHPSNLVALLDGLEAGGWLERTRDPADRRRHVVALTPAGAKLLVAAREAAEAAERELLKPLKPPERIQLEGLLRRLAAHSCGGGRA